MSTAAQQYAKCFIPLESDPSALNDLMYDLRVSSTLALTDVVSLDDQAQLILVSRPVVALILVLPTSDEYERHRRTTKATVEVPEDPRAEEVVWFRQTIDNACGLYAILHAICNFETKSFISMSVICAEDFFALTGSHRIRTQLFPEQTVHLLISLSRGFAQRVGRSRDNLQKSCRTWQYLASTG